MHELHEANFVLSCRSILCVKLIISIVVLVLGLLTHSVTVSITSTSVSTVTLAEKFLHLLI